MPGLTQPWDYLIVTASNEAQAAAYRTQLALRRQLGLLAGFAHDLVVTDIEGKRIGSGGSTMLCLMQVLARELAGRAGLEGPEGWLRALGRLRVLVMHAGGDSRRLPAYGPCGKLFIPVPGETDAAVSTTVFDRQLPIYRALPPMPDGAGQFVVTSGDVLLQFEATEVRFAHAGVTGLGSPATPYQASKHGVFCAPGSGRVRLFLQKPSPDEQAAFGAVDRYGQSILDVGVMNFDAASAVALLILCETTRQGEAFAWSGPVGEAIFRDGLDFYREICCSMGREATLEHLKAAARGAGSKLSDDLFTRIFHALAPVPFHVHLLPRCEFLHFGTTQQIITSGSRLLMADRGISQLESALSITNQFEPAGRLVGSQAWVEGCRIASTLTLDGNNVVAGLDVDEPVRLPADASLDVIAGRTRAGAAAWFVRCYGTADGFKDSIEKGGTFCGQPIEQYLARMGATLADVCPGPAPNPRSLSGWDLRLFPAVDSPSRYTQWLWTYDPGSATDAQRLAWRTADRYSLAEIAVLTDQEAFYGRRLGIHIRQIDRSLRRVFRQSSEFSAAELAYILCRSPNAPAIAADVLNEAQWYSGAERAGASMGTFAMSRVLHSLATALEQMAAGHDRPLVQLLPGLGEALSPVQHEWLADTGLSVTPAAGASAFCHAAKAEAFANLGRAIMFSVARSAPPARSPLRSDEIVWGRAPARLDLGGGWSDTPPYTLENGGCVINAAISLNGQPPVHAYARLAKDPVIRIASIDVGTKVEITSLEQLLNYHDARDEFALAKAALAMSGLSPETADWPDNVTLQSMLEAVGGGIELTTLAAIPKGSGLGTSSIVGAVVLAVVQRVLGRAMTPKDLFHGVLRLEQALTTGGGWQDQIGGAVDGVKVITTGPGLIPNPQIHYVPADVLDPHANGGATLLYYTGLTRLAKNILQQVVGRYLDRDRAAMRTLREIHALPARTAEAMARKDLPAFGKWIDRAWTLNKQLDPASSNDTIEELLRRLAPHIHGAKLLGAGGGGFLLLVCKSPADALRVRALLEADPPNPRARFFDFAIDRQGLVVTTC